jgi:hypothetical protein
MAMARWFVYDEFFIRGPSSIMTGFYRHRPHVGYKAFPAPHDQFVQHRGRSSPEDQIQIVYAVLFKACSPGNIVKFQDGSPSLLQI